MTDIDKELLLRRRRRSAGRLKYFIDKDVPQTIIDHETNLLSLLVIDCKEAGITDGEYYLYCREMGDI